MHLDEEKTMDSASADMPIQSHFDWPRATFENGSLRFEGKKGLVDAMNDGFFFLRKPERLDIEPIVMLCRNFYRKKNFRENDVYRGFKELNGLYFDRENFQTEHILLDQQARELHLTMTVRKTCDKLNMLAIQVLRAVLNHCQISPKLWEEATGGAISNRGTHWFACSHYRSEKNKPGAAAHKDTGFVTVLYVEESGLEVRLGDRWIPVDPDPNYLIVNFGEALEILTSKLPQSVHAILHRVIQTHKLPGHPDRFSSAAFINPPTESNLYRVEHGALMHHQSVRDYLDAFNKKTWDDEYDKFGT